MNKQIIATAIALAFATPAFAGDRVATKDFDIKRLEINNDLEAGDRMGNFEIQRLMSQYNQSEQLASSVQKKKDDTNNAIIGKI